MCETVGSISSTAKKKKRNKKAQRRFWSQSLHGCSSVLESWLWSGREGHDGPLRASSQAWAVGATALWPFLSRGRDQKQMVAICSHQ
jgi:hypothetical protein